MASRKTSPARSAAHAPPLKSTGVQPGEGPYGRYTAPRRPGEGARYWLVKSEPDVFSFDDLWASPGRTTSWDGVRNHQARNFMRDGMRLGDGVLFYHSNAEPTAIVGTAEVVREAYPDPTAFDRSSEYFDPKSRRDAPTWVMVDLRAVARLRTPLTLAALRDVPELAGMELLRRGSRLSVQPVTPAEWAAVLRLGGVAS
jgi:predicted RNA-binding protein with PUA-like domain